MTKPLKSVHIYCIRRKIIGQRPRSGIWGLESEKGSDNDADACHLITAGRGRYTRSILVTSNRLVKIVSHDTRTSAADRTIAEVTGFDFSKKFLKKTCGILVPNKFAQEISHSHLKVPRLETRPGTQYPD